MGRSNCAIVGCTASKLRNRGLIFHGIPIKGKNDSWRRDLIRIINRCDPSFNPDKAAICSRHFLSSCYEVSGWSETRKLIASSLPTEYLPKKSVETVKPLPRKEPLKRPPPIEVEKVIYYNIQDVMKDLKNISREWTVFSSSEDGICLGLIDNISVKLSINIKVDLSIVVKVFGLTSPETSSFNIENKKLVHFLNDIQKLQVCAGIVNPELQKIAKYKSDSNELYYRHVMFAPIGGKPDFSSAIRATDCGLLLSSGEMCKQCQHVLTLISRIQKRKAESLTRPISKTTPLTILPKSKLVSTIKQNRIKLIKTEKQLQKITQGLGIRSILLDNSFNKMSTHEHLEHHIIDGNLATVPRNAQIDNNGKC